MKHWIYYQMAMYYLRKAKKVTVNDGRMWMHYMAKSAMWIDKIKL